MNAEIAIRANDLPACCGIQPQRVAKFNGQHYITCPRCHARTIVASAASADRQWKVMADAMRQQTREEQPKPILMLRKTASQ